MARRRSFESARLSIHTARGPAHGGLQAQTHPAVSASWRKRMRGGLIWLLAIAMLLSGWTSAWAAEHRQAEADARTERAHIHAAMQALQSSLAKQEPLSDWVALALARGGAAAPNRYAAQLAKLTPDSFRLATDYARVALAVSAHGWDPRKAGPGEIDLLGHLAKDKNLTNQGPNGPAFALLAFDAGNYESAPGDLWTRDKIINWLLANRGEGGGWSLAAGKSEVDLTSIVLTALAPYKDKPAVADAIEGALDWLSSKQNEHGGFGGAGSGAESSESAAQVIIALTALDLDPAHDARFVKNGRSVLERFMSFQLADGSFAHLPGGKSDQLASLFALLALTAVDRWQDGLPGLYGGSWREQPVRVTVYGLEGRLAHGHGTGRTALETLVQVLRHEGISYVIERHPQFGPFVTAIGKLHNGTLGGFDGWQYAVRKNGAWAHDLTGMGVYEMKDAEELVVYYGETPALIHDVQLSPASPREGVPVTVTVRQETFDWESGKAVVAPAVGAKVTLGGATAVTNEDGVAELPELTAGPATLRVDGYRNGASPAFVTWEQELEVQTYVKNVTVRVEGDQGPIAAGSARGGTALEALEALLKAHGVSYEMAEMPQGAYIASIDGIQAGKYGGFDGWVFVVSGGEGGPSWIYPTESIGDYLLEEGQEVVVYYGGDTVLPETVAVGPTAARADEPVIVKVNYREMNWETWEPGPPRALAGATVSAAGVSAVTDAHGQAVLEGLPEGVHVVEVTGYGADHAPTVLRTVSRVSVAGPYSDESAIAGWASVWVREARAAGVLRGEGDEASAQTPFSPKRGITRAEFVAALVRAIGMEPSAAGADAAFGDVAADAWYAGEIEAAAQAGLVAGVAPGQFAPDSGLTREQAAMLLARALKIKTAATIPFADEAAVSPVAMSAVRAALEQGWMTLSAEGEFLPKAAVTREQAAVIAVRLLRMYEDAN